MKLTIITTCVLTTMIIATMAQPFNNLFNHMGRPRDVSPGDAEAVSGPYYVDDVGDLHTVKFEADSQRGFHVKTPYPDSNHRFNELHFQGDGRELLRGRTAIQRGLDGSYKHTPYSQDQSRCEVKDALGNTKGVYAYIGKDGTERYVFYIAGPNIGYRIVYRGPVSGQDPMSSYYLHYAGSQLGVDLGSGTGEAVSARAGGLFFGGNGDNSGEDNTSGGAGSCQSESNNNNNKRGCSRSSRSENNSNN